MSMYGESLSKSMANWMQYKNNNNNSKTGDVEVEDQLATERSDKSQAINLKSGTSLEGKTK